MNDGNNGDVLLPDCEEDQIGESVYFRKTQWLYVRRKGLGPLRDVGQASLDHLPKPVTQGRRDVLVEGDRIRQVLWDLGVKDKLMSHGADLHGPRPDPQTAQSHSHGNQAPQVSLEPIDDATLAPEAALANHQYCPRGLGQVAIVQQVEAARAVPWQDASAVSFVGERQFVVNARLPYHTTANLTGRDRVRRAHFALNLHRS